MRPEDSRWWWESVGPLDADDNANFMRSAELGGKSMALGDICVHGILCVAQYKLRSSFIHLPIPQTTDLPNSIGHSLSPKHSRCNRPAHANRFHLTSRSLASGCAPGESFSFPRQDHSLQLHTCELLRTSCGARVRIILVHRWDTLPPKDGRVLKKAPSNRQAT